VPTSTTFGPLFAERAVTIGAKKFNFGYTFQAVSFDSYEGVKLDTDGLKFVSQHNDCCPGGVGIVSNPTDFNPEFERDLLVSTLHADITTRTNAFFANYGVTNRFDTLEHDFAIPRQEKAEWKGADGVTIEGVLYYPADYRAGQKYPLVVQLHGGPMESDKFGIGAASTLHYLPVLTGKGYFVLRPKRSSTSSRPANTDGPVTTSTSRAFWIGSALRTHGRGGPG
jgi:dipeptidyl aminopeptidase/acylaminoacyl peptidase